jgi:glycosyltransferase involved in cell wall biosynthesis
MVSHTQTLPGPWAFRETGTAHEAAAPASEYNLAVRILLLNLYFPPDTSATAKMALGMAESLSRQHEVTVVCGRPSYDPTERRPWRTSQTEQMGKLRVIRVGSTDYPRFQMKRRLLNYLSYVTLVLPRALFVPCDVVLAMTDPPFQGIVGAFVALLKRKPYVYNIRDLYPDMAVGGELLQPGLLVRLWEKMHRWALRRAARVIVLGEDMRSRIITKGVDPGRVVVVRDGLELPPPDAPAAPLDPEVIQAIRGDARFVLVHAGNLGFYGAWDTLLRAARDLVPDGVRLVFVGDGAQRNQLQASAAGSPNVVFLPFFPGDKIPSVLGAADAHIVTIKRGLEGVVVPSKFYGILAAGKPIVAVTPSETDVAALGAGQGFSVCCNPDHPEELVAAVRSLLADPARVQLLGAAARAAAPDYDRSSEAENFVHIVGVVASSGAC